MIMQIIIIVGLHKGELVELITATQSHTVTSAAKGNSNITKIFDYSMCPL